LDTAISDLQSISETANPAFQDTQNSATMLRNELRERLLQEESAITLITQAQQEAEVAEQAQQEAEVAKQAAQSEQSDEAYRTARHHWETALEILRQISSNSFEYYRISDLSESYQRKIDELPPDCKVAFLASCVKYPKN
jgi:predicted  nucleic acid-binding Zn ribbon protein